MNIFAITSYKGTSYQGWQKQSDALTIQEEIEKVLSKILNTSILINGSGRTDAGVHAKGQTFSFKVDKDDLDLEKLRYSCNCLLPKDIHILSFKKVNDDFHARYSAKGKHYSYTIVKGENNPLNNELVSNIEIPFDTDLFIKAIKEFSGKHDFRDFTSKEDDESNFVRNIEINAVSAGNIIRIDFNGDGFMRYMIRFMVGVALAIAMNKEDISYIKKHLDTTSKRSITSYKAMSNGLILEEVFY